MNSPKSAKITIEPENFGNVRNMFTTSLSPVTTVLVYATHSQYKQLSPFELNYYVTICCLAM